MFTKYGYNTIGIISLISFILIAVGIFTNNLPVRIVLIAFSILLMIFTLNFFRDPDRVPPEEENVIISPADGRVLFVKEVDADCYVQDKAVQISIFMSPLNVHVNRIPITGIVEYVKYHKGEYLVAYDDKASKLNERNEIGINNEKFGKVFFSQIAGFVARIIVYYIKNGDRVKTGERFGMIKFGSRVDVVVPAGWIAKVKKDDVVKAGETILFEFPQKVD
jgi:phosphatidylserine decarboxylase